MSAMSSPQGADPPPSARRAITTSFTWKELLDCLASADTTTGALAAKARASTGMDLDTLLGGLKRSASSL
jgi:hypothetical protein